MCWIVIIVFVVHCVVAFFLSYCFDTAELWKDNEEPSLQMPSIYDLPEDCGRRTMEKYINEQIIPARDYFSFKRSIENMQDSGAEPIIVYLVTHIVPSFFVGATLYKMDVMPKFLCFALPFIGCVVVSCLVYLIYRKSRFLIRSNKDDKTSLKKEYDNRIEHYKRVTENKNSEHSSFRITAFEVDEETDFNNFVISRHNDYLAGIYKTVKKRYYVRKCIAFVCGAIYILFIHKMPD